MSALRHNPLHSSEGKYLCTICDKPLKIETAKTDEDGQAVHEECYVDKSAGKIPPKLRKPPATQS